MTSAVAAIPHSITTESGGDRIYGGAGSDAIDGGTHLDNPEISDSVFAAVQEWEVVDDEDAYGGKYRYREADLNDPDGGHAYWQFLGYDDGTRFGDLQATRAEIFATWVPIGSGATPAFYYVYDGDHDTGQRIGKVEVDQNVPPPGDESPEPDDHPWKSLGVFPIGSGELFEHGLTVELSDYDYDSQSCLFNDLVADAVMVRPLWPRLDLATDSNNDGTIDPTPHGPDDRIEMASPGRIVGVNDKNRAEVQVRLDPLDYNLSGSLLQLTWETDTVTVWDAPSEGNQLSFEETIWPMSEEDFQTGLYVQGIAPGTSVFTLRLLDAPYAQPVDDQVKIRVVEVEDYTVEVEEWDGSWSILSRNEAFWEDYDLRWRVDGLPADVWDSVTQVEWRTQPWLEDGNEPPSEWEPGEYDTFATASYSGDYQNDPVEGSIPLGVWVVAPVVHFASGALSTLFMAKNESKHDYCVIWETVNFDTTPASSNYVPNGIAQEFGIDAGDAVYPEKREPGFRDTSPMWQDYYDRIFVTVYLRSTEILAPGKGLHGGIYILDPDHYSRDLDFDPNGHEGPNQPGDNVSGGFDASGKPLQSLGAQFMKWNEVLNRYERKSSPSQATVSFYGREYGVGIPKTPTRPFPGPDGPERPYVSTLMEITQPHPTNNFIVLGRHDRCFASEDLRFASDGKTPQWRERHNSPWIDAPKPARTNLLTVARTLYVERDSMEAPTDQDFEQPSHPSRIPGPGTLTRTDNPSIFKIDQAIEQADGNQFEGGKITLLNSGGNPVREEPYQVVHNSFGNTPKIQISEPIPADAVKWRHLEDDDFEHEVTGADMVVDTSLWAERLAAAFIRLNTTKTDLSPANADNVNNDQVDFQLNVGDYPPLGGFRTAFMDLIDREKDTGVEPSFWCAHMVGAFQPWWIEDGDHYVIDGGVVRQSHVMGVTLSSSMMIDSSMLFRETIADRWHFGTNPQIAEEELAAVASVHELGHLFGLEDDFEDGLLMDKDEITVMLEGGEPEIYNLVFSGMGLRKIVMKLGPYG